MFLTIKSLRIFFLLFIFLNPILNSQENYLISSSDKIEETVEAEFPLQTTILMTDGRFYDMPYPEEATTGLVAYKAIRFAIGIAVAQGDNSYGLTEQEKVCLKKVLGFSPFSFVRARG